MPNIADKIAKIIEKAESTTHPEEAESFMAKAYAMLEEHGMTLMDLGTLSTEDPVGVTENVSHYFQSESYTRHVASALARYYGAQIVLCFETKYKTNLAVVGRDSARVTFQLMLPYVAKEIRRLARGMVDAGDFKTMSKAKTSIGNALAVRLRRLAAEAEKSREVKSDSTGVNALVPVDIIEQVKLDHFPDLRPVRAGRISWDRKAENAANSINLNRQATGNTVRKIGR